MKKKGSKTLRLEGLIPALEEDAKAYENLDQKAMAYLDKIGMKLPDQPLKNGKPLVPIMPISLDALDGRGLSNLYSQLNAYFAYATAQYDTLKTKLKGLQEKLEMTEAKIMFLLPPPEASKKTRARLDPRVDKIKKELVDIEAKMTLVSTVVSTTHSRMSLVSREVKIRELEFEGVNREENMKRGRHGVSGGRRVR